MNQAHFNKSSYGSLSIFGLNCSEMATGLSAQPIFYMEATLRDDVMNTFSVLSTNPLETVNIKTFTGKVLIRAVN